MVTAGLLPGLYGGLVVLAGMVVAVLYARAREPKRSAKLAAARIAAIDSGKRKRLTCWVRAAYGDYPRRFSGYLAVLSPAGLILHPGLLARFRLQTITVAEPIIEAHVRPFESKEEERRFSSGFLHGAGQALEAAGQVVITCRTPEGVLEFAVMRRHVPVLLHYLESLGRRQPGPASANPS